MKKQKTDVLYIACTNDELELTLCAFDTLAELSKWAGRHIATVKQLINTSKPDLENHCKYMKVTIPKDFDEIAFFDLKIKIILNF